MHSLSLALRHEIDDVQSAAVQLRDLVDELPPHLAARTLLALEAVAGQLSELVDAARDFHGAVREPAAKNATGSVFAPALDAGDVPGLQRIVSSLADRVAVQAELLGQRAEGPAPTPTLASGGLDGREAAGTARLRSGGGSCSPLARCGGQRQ